MKTGQLEGTPRAVVGEGWRIAWALFYMISQQSQMSLLALFIADNLAIAVPDVLFNINIAEDKGCAYFCKAEEL